MENACSSQNKHEYNRIFCFIFIGDSGHSFSFGHSQQWNGWECVALTEREAQNKRSSWSLSSSQGWLWIFVYVWEELPWYHLLEKKKKKKPNEEQGTEQLIALYSQGLVKWKNWQFLQDCEKETNRWTGGPPFLCSVIISWKKKQQPI